MQEASVIGIVGKVAPDIGLNGREQLRVELSARTGRGERVKTTHFTVFLWQTFLSDLIVPGTMIYVQGELRAHAFINNEGKAVPSLTIYGNNLFLLGNPYNFSNFEEVDGYNKYSKVMENIPERKKKAPLPEDSEDPEDFFGKNGEYPF